MRHETITSAELKAIRLRFGLTQREFARCLGHSENSLYQMETGRKPATETTQRVAEAFSMCAEFRLMVMKENGL